MFTFLIHSKKERKKIRTDSREEALHGGSSTEPGYCVPKNEIKYTNSGTSRMKQTIRDI